MVESKKELLYKSLHVRPCAKDKFILLKDFEYDGIIVPAGYITNGADIPRIIWWLIPPNKPEYLPAVVLHDFLCDLERYEEADRIFLKCMKDLEVHFIKRRTMHTSVVSYHYVRYYIPSNIKRIIKS